jgi:hypothetical protein
MDFLIVFVIIVGFTLLEMFFDIGVILLLKRFFNKKLNDNKNIAAIIVKIISITVVIMIVIMVIIEFIKSS